MTWGRHRIVLLLALIFLATCTLSQADTKGPADDYPVGPSIIPLSVHYLTDEGNVRKKFEHSLAKSNELLMPHGIALVVWTEDRTYRLPSRVMTKQDRQRLAGLVDEDGTLHVFMVDDVSLDPEVRLYGLHTRPNSRAHDFVIVTRDARLSTLAHEVGHALGLDHVPDGTDNVMSIERDWTKVHFTPEQGATMRAKARKFVQRDWD